MAGLQDGKVVSNLLVGLARARMLGYNININSSTTVVLECRIFARIALDFSTSIWLALSVGVALRLHRD